MKIHPLFLLVFSLIVFYPIQTNSAEILQINSSNNILVGDQNRNLTIKLFCSNVNKDEESTAIDLLKKEFPRGNKVKIKPLGFSENILITRVFNIDETKEMSELLITKGLSEKNCQNGNLVSADEAPLS